MIGDDRAEKLHNITDVMDVVRGWVALVRRMGWMPCLFFVSEFKEEK